MKAWAGVSAVAEFHYAVALELPLPVDTQRANISETGNRRMGHELLCPTQVSIGN